MQRFSARTALVSNSIAVVLALLFPSPAHAAFIPVIYCGNLPGCNENNLGVTQFFTALMNILLANMQVYAIALAIVFVMIGGAYILTGTEENVTKGKNTIYWALIGIFLLVSAGRFISMITSEIPALPTGTDPVLTIAGIIVSDIGQLLSLALFGIATYNGMRMVAARGKEDEFSAARQALIYAVIGAIIINVADPLVRAIWTL